MDDVFAGGTADGEHELLSVAIGAGLFHWNCRHKKTIWYPGVKEAKGKEDYDPDKVADTYRIEQRQRALERKIREYKRMAATALDPDTATHAEQNVRIYQAALSKLVADARHDGYAIYRQYNKEQVGFDYGKWDPYGIHGGNDDDFQGGGSGGGYNGGGGGTLPVNGDTLPQETVGRATVYEGATGEVPDADFAFLQSREYAKRFEGITSNEQVRTKIAKVARECIRENDGESRESLVVLDLKSGARLARSRGRKYDVNQPADSNLPDGDWEEHESIMIHNHPHSGTFSLKDIAVLLGYEQVKIVVAVGHDGTVYTMKKLTRGIIQRGVLVTERGLLANSISNAYNGAREKYHDGDPMLDAAALQSMGIEYYINGVKIQ